MVYRRLFTEWVALLSIGIALAFLAARMDLANRIDASLLDRAAAMARPAPSDDIVIVAIDDASLAEVGNWPWSRTVHAEMVDRLAEARSGPILFDVLFLESSETDADVQLADAMMRHGEVVLPHTFAPQPNAIAGIVPVFPATPLYESAAATGHVAITPDNDGVLRRFDLNIEADSQLHPHFALAAARLAADAIDYDPGARPILSFHPAGTYSSISAAQVISGSVPEEFLRAKTVLIGATAQGMGDRYSVGAGSVSVMAGVETQANLYDALRTGGLVTDWPPFWPGLLAAVGLLVQFLVFWKMSPRAGLVATFGIAIFVVAFAILLVPLTGAWIAPGVALLAILLAYPFWSWRRLTSVSAYLEEEAAFLRPEGDKRASVEGFDKIARQVARMRRLVSHVSRSFAFLGKVIEAAPDAILVLDRSADVVMANDKAKHLFPSWHEDRPEQLDNLLAVSSAIQDSERSEIIFPDGRTFLVARADFELEAEAEGGEIVALRDVSETRRRDQERREMLEFLSHDMRTPQVAIVGLTRRAEQAGEAADIPYRIRRQAQRTLKLADDFVQLARLDEAELNFEDTDCIALVEEACDRAYSPARAKRMTVEPELPESPIFVQVDASLIARLLDNLLGNAIKFAPEGSVVRIGIDESLEGQFRLWVADTGPGLPTERLANPFSRFGAHEHKAGPSVGLGLAFVKRVVDRHDGSITVASRRDQGTRFEIELPLRRDTPED